MKIDFPDAPGIRELLDQFGDDAVKLESELRQIGSTNISSRLVAIAQALWLAHAKGEAEAIIRDELERRGEAPDRRG